MKYELVEESGPAHSKRYCVAAVVDGERRGMGEGRSKKAAEQQAAYDALRAENPKARA